MKYIPAAGEFVEVVKNSSQALMLQNSSGNKRMAAPGDIFEVVAVGSSYKKILCRTRYGECHWGGRNLQGHQMFNLGDVKASPLWFRVGNKVAVTSDLSHAFKIENGEVRSARKGDVFKVVQISHAADVILVQSDPHPSFHVDWYGMRVDQTHWLHLSEIKRDAQDCVCDSYTLGVSGCKCGWFQKEQELKRAAQTN
jgi:hypothetical protein